MFRSCNRHVDPIVLFNEVAWLCAHHCYENYVELASLRAIDRYDMIFHSFCGKFVCKRILLGIVRSDDIDALLGETLVRDLRNLFIDSFAFLRPVCYEFYHVIGGLYLLIVDKRGSFEFFLPFNIYEKKWLLCVDEDLLRVSSIAAVDRIVVE